MFEYMCGGGFVCGTKPLEAHMCMCITKQKADRAISEATSFD